MLTSGSERLVEGQRKEARLADVDAFHRGQIEIDYSEPKRRIEICQTMQNDGLPGSGAATQQPGTDVSPFGTASSSPDDLFDIAPEFFFSFLFLFLFSVDNL